MYRRRVSIELEKELLSIKAPYNFILSRRFNMSHDVRKQVGGTNSRMELWSAGFMQVDIDMVCVPCTTAGSYILEEISVDESDILNTLEKELKSLQSDNTQLKRDTELFLKPIKTIAGLRKVWKNIDDVYVIPVPSPIAPVKSSDELLKLMKLFRG